MPPMLRQCATTAITAVYAASIMFTMAAMLGRLVAQLKVPRLDAYALTTVCGAMVAGERLSTVALRGCSGPWGGVAKGRCGRRRRDASAPAHNFAACLVAGRWPQVSTCRVCSASRSPEGAEQGLARANGYYPRYALRAPAHCGHAHRAWISFSTSSLRVGPRHASSRTTLT